MERDTDLYWWMGLALLMVQAAEGALADALAMVFPPGGMISIESLDAGDEMARRKTLGGLLTELRRRSEIGQDFDDVLRAFLSARNEFIHRFTRTFSLASPEGHAAGIEFCKSLGGQAHLVARTLMGAVFAQYQYIAETTGAPVAVDWESMPASAREQIGLGIIAARTRLGNWQGSA
jgi:hypothetical protein